MRYLARYPRFFAATWAFIMLLLCATPGSLIPDADWMDLLSIDKLVHASMFFILCSLVFYASTHVAEIVWWALLSVFYGFLLEYFQANYFSDRSADWKDVIANSFGVLVAILTYRRIKNYLLRFI